MRMYHRVSLKLLLLVPLVFLVLCAEGAEQAEPRSFNIDPRDLQQVHEDAQSYPEQDQVPRFMCPAGFFRIRKFCYYLSAGMTNWRDAHFQCVLRNATLAVLNRHGKDKTLRKYLMGDQFSKLERWIGGIYNWRQMNWEWGVTSDKVLFQNFGTPSAMRPRKHDCMVMDPELQYKWNARRCFESKYFICEAPAGRIGKSRRRKNISDPLAPQNQRLRPTNRDERQQLNQLRRNKNKLRSMRKKNWHPHEDHQVWAHGIKPGSRPPKGMRRQRLGGRKGNRIGKPGHRLNRKPEPRISQVTPGPGEFGAFSANKDQHHLQSLSNDEVLFPPPFDARSVFTQEKVLLQP